MQCSRSVSLFLVQQSLHCIVLSVGCIVRCSTYSFIEHAVRYITCSGISSTVIILCSNVTVTS